MIMHTNQYFATLFTTNEVGINKTSMNDIKNFYMY